MVSAPDISSQLPEPEVRFYSQGAVWSPDLGYSMDGGSQPATRLFTYARSEARGPNNSEHLKFALLIAPATCQYSVRPLRDRLSYTTLQELELRREFHTESPQSKSIRDTASGSLRPAAYRPDCKPVSSPGLPSEGTSRVSCPREVRCESARLTRQGLVHYCVRIRHGKRGKLRCCRWTQGSESSK